MRVSIVRVRDDLCLQYGFFDDKLGPVTLCVLIMLSLTAIMVRLSPLKLPSSRVESC